LKVSTNVEIAMQCFENFGGKMPQIPPPRLRAWLQQLQHFDRVTTDCCETLAQALAL